MRNLYEAEVKKYELIVDGKREEYARSYKISLDLPNYALVSADPGQETGWENICITEEFKAASGAKAQRKLLIDEIEKLR